MLLLFWLLLLLVVKVCEWIGLKCPRHAINCEMALINKQSNETSQRHELKQFLQKSGNFELIGTPGAIVINTHYSQNERSYDRNICLYVTKCWNDCITEKRLYYGEMIVLRRKDCITEKRLYYCHMTVATDKLSRS